MARPKKAEQQELLAWQRDVRQGHPLALKGTKIFECSTTALQIMRPIFDLYGCRVLRVWTWTVGIEEAKELARLYNKGAFGTAKFLVDTSFVKRLPEAYDTICKQFGNVRNISTHAKIYIVEGRTKSVAILSSANLNRNTRCEFFHFVNDPEDIAAIVAKFETLYGRKKERSKKARK
ncbi:hypothetical protein KDA14_06260 [Candidatus Saccharibacteria bacterium]|nr:hypothetical protein [Candidatus Saccharibacteria bacterium]